MAVNGFDGINLYGNGNGFFNEWAPTGWSNQKAGLSNQELENLQKGLSRNNVSTSAIYPHKDGNTYAKMLEQQRTQNIVARKADAGVRAQGNSSAVMNKFEQELKTKVDKYRAAMKKQGMSGAQLEEQVARYEKGLRDDYRKQFNKKKGKTNAARIAKERGNQKPVKPEPVKPEAVKPEAVKPDAVKPDAVKPDATKKGFKIPKGLKKAGKIGGLILATGLAIAGIATLFKGCESEKEKPVEKVITPPVVDETPEETPEETKPQEPVVKDLPNGMQLVDGVYTVRKGDCVWNIAKAYLIGTSEDPNYVPTDAEILAKTKEIMALSKDQESIDLGLKTLDFDNTRDPKNWYVLIQPGQKILIESQKTEKPEEKQEEKPEEEVPAAA